MSSKNSEERPAGPVESPCRRQCCLDEQEVCLGCGRSLAEILEWGSASNTRRREICAASQGRLRPPWGPRLNP